MMALNMEEVRSQFEAVKSVIEGIEPSDGWQVRIETFPQEREPQGLAIQLAKKGWFNEDGMGIHFETWVSEKEAASQKLKFVMHVLHQEFFPGSEKKPWDFLGPFLEDVEVEDYVREWPGFQMGRSVPIKGQKRIAGSVTEVVELEFRRFLKLGGRVDAALEKTLTASP